MNLVRNSMILWIASIFFVNALLAQTNAQLVILGTLQDGGSPHIGCARDCCKNIDPTKKVVSLGLIDPSSQKKFLFEATPDMVSQLKYLQERLPGSSPLPDGIFLSHAHMGHYTGLMYLGREAMNSQQVPVYAMPIFKKYLETNGPWSQLVSLKNIQIHELKDGEEIKLSSTISITPLKVPHRDEYSETVGYMIQGPYKKVLFIPDIDKWSKWHRNIVDAVSTVDYALIDATFYNNAEVGYRNIAEIPHPLVEETMQLFEKLPEKEKQKIVFIHMNHTNPLLIKNSPQRLWLETKRFKVAFIGQIIDL